MNIIELLKKEEGLRLKPYRCTAGKLTIGIGRNLEDTGISEDEAEYLCRNDIANAEAVAVATFGGRDWSSWEEPRQAAILSMIFQLGAVGFKSFKATIQCLKEHRWSDAAANMLRSRWAAQTPARVKRAAAMVSTAEWPTYD